MTDQVSAPRAELAGSLSGTELRCAALEAMGWTHDIGGMWVHTLKGRRLHINELAIELSPSVSETLFLEWCKQNHYLWDTYLTAQGAVSCAVYRHDHNGIVAHVFGDTPSEARARAIASARGANPKDPKEVSK